MTGHKAKSIYTKIRRGGRTWYSQTVASSAFARSAKWAQLLRSAMGRIWWWYGGGSRNDGVYKWGHIEGASKAATSADAPVTSREWPRVIGFIAEVKNCGKSSGRSSASLKSNNVWWWRMGKSVFPIFCVPENRHNSDTRALYEKRMSISVFFSLLFFFFRMSHLTNGFFSVESNCDIWNFVLNNESVNVVHCGYTKWKKWVTL